MRYLITLILLISLSVHATSWTAITVADPIKPGSACAVNAITSYGDYVYDWPSKYDQIFFPFTSSLAIWYCRDSGFISFMGDFEQLTAAEKNAIANYLSSTAQATPQNLLAKLELLENIYAFRSLPPEASNHNKRVLAYLYEQINEFDKANTLRSAALQQIYQLLDTNISGYSRLQYLYVAANYERQLGQAIRSDEMAGKLLNEIDKLQEDKLKHFAEYLHKLAAEIPSIQPGDKLAPPKENELLPKTKNVRHHLMEQFPEKCHKEMAALIDNLNLTLTAHFEQSLLDKNLSELLAIRRILIKTGQVPHDILMAYQHYSSIGPEQKIALKKAKNATAQVCSRELDKFYELFLLEGNNHIAKVIEHITAPLTSMNDENQQQNSTITLAVIDDILIKNSIYYLYCYTTDYDLTEYLPCPEKAIRHKDFFIQLHTDITQFPLQTSDAESVQKLFAGLASLGI